MTGTRRPSWLVVLVLASACSADAVRDRTASPDPDDELARSIDLAFRAQAGSGTYSDTALSVPSETEPEPAVPATTPVRQPEREPTQAPRPAPRSESPMQATPREPLPADEPDVAIEQRNDEPRARSDDERRTPVDREDRTPRERDVRMEVRRAGRSVPAGTSMTLVLDQTLSTQTNRAGDSFTATLQRPVRDPNGRVLIPMGAIVRGRLTAVSHSGHVGEAGILKLAFESISFEGRSYPLNGTVVRANPQRASRSSTRSTAGKIAAGTVAGALIGRAIGGDKGDAVKGAVIGAAAGTAIAMGTADVDVVLPSGSEMDIRLDSSIWIERF